MSRVLFSRFANYLDEIARHGSIRKAAEQLNVSPSAVDKQLIQAEEELGVALFERLPRGVRLTTAGEILLNGLRGWKKDFSRVRFEIEELKGLRRGEVTIALPQEAVLDFMAESLASFIKDHPRISNHVLVAGSDQIRQMVLDGQADFGLTFSPPPMPGITVTSTLTFALGAIVPAGEAPASRKSLSLGEFFQRPTIIPDSSIHLRDIAEIAALKGKTRLQPVLTSNNMELLRLMVRQGCGYGLTAALADTAATVGDGLAYLPISDKGMPSLTLSLITPSDRKLSLTSVLARRYMDVYFGGRRPSPDSAPEAT